MITPDETPRLNIRHELGKHAMPKSWRDWFDALQAAGVDRMRQGPSFGSGYGELQPAALPATGYQPSATPDPTFQTAIKGLQRGGAYKGRR